MFSSNILILDVFFGILVLMESGGLYLKKCEHLNMLERRRLVQEPKIESFFKKENDICNNINKNNSKIVPNNYQSCDETSEYVRNMFRH